MLEHDQSVWVRSLFDSLNKNIVGPRPVLGETLHLCRCRLDLCRASHRPRASAQWQDTFVNTLGGDKGLMSSSTAADPGWYVPAAGHHFAEPGKSPPSSPLQNQCQSAFCE
eukprot:gnl/TRDRNA2_/TRDRNA2_69713_c0_seq1.p1 gnl/TRDRNA2_/TRDRNA2_69713_c0~~gnl/TRDRNA2_/TRDRNA2_69713_c0_seq1.p1  ORF type:complete len:111 (+),score=9.56 gnl/TRDRNA2_/TRDRNA2_69713_c0_seq1:268-600(+)